MDNPGRSGPDGRGPEARGILAELVAAGFLPHAEGVVLTPLSGGVSSDIFRLETPEGRAFAVKRSIPRLRVAVPWFAAGARAANEIAWLEAARAVDPRLAPEVLFAAPGGRLFVMAYLEPATHPLWKSELAAGRVDLAFAAAVGTALAHLHAATAGSADLAARFGDRSYFHDLRVEPFFLYPAKAHPRVADRLGALAADLETRAQALVHGDISPKNILKGPGGPVFLDAETAVFGDPAFDLAFCLSHLLLKAVWVRRAREAMAQAFDAFAAAYGAGVAWEPREALLTRTAPLTAALLLARIDGRSPVPYLEAPADKALVRDLALEFLARTDLSLSELARDWRAAVSAAAG